MSRILKLERMDIIGFKSFYGRTRFDFPEGITAVVGPNGCGKSNIGDAISWVLGEQKASSLRSDRMEDVIFNGSEARRPLGMAEVSLHFRNLLSTPGGNGHGAAAGGNGHGGIGAAVIEPPAAAVPAGEDRVVALPVTLEQLPAGDPGPEEEEAGEEARPRVFAIEEIPESVVVTRRVYRSGESEYILNGVRCRLKDIQDLLARTDVGSRLYSTIEQGKIDQILTARPKDRRLLFEEAAGILGYKTRRRQAEAKLEAAQANLLRIADIAAEVDKQIQSLKRQAAKARRHQRLLETLREKRLVLARVRLRALESDRSAAEEALGTLRAEEAEASVALTRDEAELEALRQRLDEGEAAARVRREEIHALDLELDRLAERSRAGEEQERDLKARLDDATREAEGLRARAAELLSRRDALAEAVQRESAALRESAEGHRLAEEAAAAEAAGLASVETGLEEARADLVRLLEEAAILSRRRAALDEQMRSEQAALVRLRDHEAEQSDGRREMVAALAALETEAAHAAGRLEELQRERDRLGGGRETAAARLEEAERRLEERRGREAALRERLLTLERMAREHAGYAEAVRHVLQGGSGITARGVAGERLQVPRGLERAVEAALGERLQAVLVDAAGDALRGVDHLRGGAAGRASFAPTYGPSMPRPDLPATLGAAADMRGRLGDLVGAPEAPAIRAILDGTILVESLAAAVDLQAAHPAFNFVTPQGDLVDREGVVTGGDGRVLDHGLLARRAETDEVAGRVAEEEHALRDAEAALSGLRAAAAEARDAEAGADAAVREQERGVFERELQRQQKAAEIARMDHAAPTRSAEIERLGRAVAEAVARRDALAAECAVAEDRRRGIEESIRTGGEALAARRFALDEARRRAAGIAAAAAAGQEKVEGLGREHQAALEALAEIQATLERRRGESDEWRARIATLLEQAEASRSERDARQSLRADAAARDEAAHAGLAYERSLVHAREQAVKEKRQMHADRTSRVQERELQRTRVEAYLDGLAATCRDELGTGLEALRALPLPAEERPFDELEREIEQIRSDLDGIGPVNLMAIEQHGELEERFQFLSAQKKDLEDSVASLHETIRRINRQSRERFQIAFEAIQGHFLQTFQTLFGGGRAELRLQEDEDMLEAGIEIVAQPPGKRLQKIALLSGGEKALTAAALLFSLFRYRPSPFCVLDEVDAPLDEANVERFTRLLKALREDTQFILITHNRKSMEAADLLYGVTMEEPGVSKVLPLRFE